MVHKASSTDWSSFLLPISVSLVASCWFPVERAPVDPDRGSRAASASHRRASRIRLPHGRSGLPAGLGAGASARLAACRPPRRLCCQLSLRKRMARHPSRRNLARERARRTCRGQSQEARASESGAAPTGARASRAVPGIHARALSQAASEACQGRVQRAAGLWGPVAGGHARQVPSLPARVLCRLQLRCEDGLSVVLGPAHGNCQRAPDRSGLA